MQEKTFKSIIIGSVAFGVCLILTLICVAIVQFVCIKREKNNQILLQTQYEQILAKKQSTITAVEQLEGNQFIEAYAREVLGYAKPGEFKYVAEE